MAWTSRSVAAAASAARHSSPSLAMVSGVGVRSTVARRSRLCAGGGLGVRLGLLHQGAERCRTRYREFRQALAIERHAGLLETVDELAVRETVLARGSVDANHPDA